MYKKRLQNKISESRWSLPILVLPTVAVWVLSCLSDFSVLPSLLCVLFSTYLMLELNNANALLRIYSRVVSCSFLLFATQFLPQLSQLTPAIVVLCMIGFLTCIFRVYQDPKGTGWIFYAFLCIGLSSILWPHILYFLPILWMVLSIDILALSPKTFTASLLGILFPNLLYSGCLIGTDHLDFLIAHYVGLQHFSPILNFNQLSGPQIVNALWIILCALIGTVHYIRQKRKDSIRTRLLYRSLMTLTWSAVAFLCLQPHHYNELMGIIIVATSPLIGHFLALTYTKWTNLAFKFLAVGTFILTIYNFIYYLWLHSLKFF